MENFGFLFLVCAVFPLIIMQQGLHTIDEGHIGVYFRGGAILDSTSEPGWHTKLPFITTYE
jgi:regulator of protease activity HflC (stomatin/prohibitin superfamily)